MMSFLLAILCGVSAGLRSMTPLAVVSWAAQSWPDVRASSVGFMSSATAAYIFTALAVLELISDKLPFTPSRLTPGPLGARILSGGLCGAVLCAATQQTLIGGAIAGAIGGAAGSFAGFAGRRHFALVTKRPFLVAILEDLLAIGLATLAVAAI
jgi:uncharacterized membrane protein